MNQIAGADPQSCHPKRKTHPAPQDLTMVRRDPDRIFSMSVSQDHECHAVKIGGDGNEGGGDLDTIRQGQGPHLGPEDNPGDQDAQDQRQFEAEINPIVEACDRHMVAQTGTGDFKDGFYEDES
jgi:hypothetical protein